MSADTERAYLLWATQGEYSERIEWPVALYADEADAQADVTRGEALHRKLFRGGDRPSWEEQKVVWQTPEGVELRLIVGQECSEYDDLYLTCAWVEVRATRKAQGK